MSKGQNLGLALIASAVMAAPAYGQAYGAQGERIVCTRDFNTGAVVCPQPQQQQVYVPTGPAQQPPVVVAQPQQPNPVATFFVGLAAGVVGAAIANRGHHHGGPGYVGGPRYVAPADRPYYDNRAVTIDPHGYVYRNPSNGCYRTDRGSVHCP